MEVKKADNKNFGDYGKVVNTPSGKPVSEGEDYKFWSDIADYNIDGDAEIGICTVYKQENSIIKIVERHLNTPEILIPIDAPFILPVIKEGEDRSRMKYFEAGIGEALVINKAVWHGPCIPVGKKESSYFVIFKKRTPFEDVEKKQLI